MTSHSAESTPETREARQLAERCGLPFVDLSDYREDVALWQRVHMELVLRYRFVPVREEKTALVVAVGDPESYRQLDELELALGRPLKFLVAPRSQIEAILERNASSSFLLEEASEQRAQERYELGKAEGKTEGEAKGELDSCRTLLCRLLEKRFGPLSDDLRRRIEASTDIEKLRTCIEQVLDITSPDELAL